MHDLIYFNRAIADAIDSGLRNSDYPHHKWFNNNQPDLRWPSHIVSRVHKLDTPWSLAGTVLPIPQLLSDEMSFETTIESIADQFCQTISQTNLTPYFFWSGGIDSTSILVSILKVANSEVLSKLVIVCSHESIQENAYLYYKYIDQKIQVLELGKFSITQDNYDKVLILDGEGAGSIVGWRGLTRLANYKLFDFLDSDWRASKDLTKIIPGSNSFVIELIIESIKYSQVPIITVYDFIWWYGFNYVIEDMVLTKMIAYTQALTPAQSKHLFYNGMFRFYTHPLMQQWSMASLRQRREKIRISHKWHQKNYIYQFDRNDLWFSYKKQQSSYGNEFYQLAYSPSLIAIDKDWNKYNITDASTRVTLGTILQRI